MRNWRHRICTTTDMIEVRRGYKKQVLFYMRADLGYGEVEIDRAVKYYDYVIKNKIRFKQLNGRPVTPDTIVYMTMTRPRNRSERDEVRRFQASAARSYEAIFGRAK